MRRASIALDKDGDLRDVYTSTFALIFFGTPHRGGAYTDLGLTATRIAKVAGFSVNDRNIRDLKGNSPVLTLIRDGFAQLLDSDNFEVSTFQESLGYSGMGLLDDKVSLRGQDLLICTFLACSINASRHSNCLF